MAFNGSGVFQRLYSWVTDRDAGTKINSTRMDAEMDGMVVGLNQVVDGTQGFIGPVRGPNGTVALPGHSFTDDTDTGMYRSAANELSLSAGGSQELVISTGFVDAVNGFKIGGTEVTATPAQLNELGAFASALALPSADGTNGQVLSTDGAGNLVFSTPASGMSASSTATFTNKTFDADGTGNSITNIENANIKTGAAIDATKLANGTVSNARFQYLSGVTSDIQTQLDAAGGGGGLIPIGKTTASDDAAVDISLSGYSAYAIRLSNVRSSTSAHFLLRTSSDAGVSFDSGATDYEWGNLSATNASLRDEGSTGDSSIRLTNFSALSNSTHTRLDGWVYIYPANGSQRTGIQTNTMALGASYSEGISGSGMRSDATTVDAVRLLFASGNIASGDIHLYGIADGA